MGPERRQALIYGAEMGTSTTAMALILAKLTSHENGPIFRTIDSFVNALAQRGISPEITLFTAALISGALAENALSLRKH